MADLTPPPPHVPPELVRPFELDFRGPLEDLFPRFDALRNEGRVLWLHMKMPKGFDGRDNGAWFFTRADDIRAALQDTSLFSSNMAAAGSVLPQMIPIFMDPPEHTRYRRLLAPLFAPAAVKTMEDGIRARAQGLIEGLAARGACEFVSDFAIQFPTRVFTSWMGFPEQETPRFVALTSALIHGTEQERVVAGAGAFQVVSQLVAERMAHPGSDLMSEIIARDLEGRPLSNDELLRIAMLLFLAGLDTVAAALSFSFWHLARTPADRQAITRQSVPTAQAVEELLRRHSFVNTPRRVARDAEFAGVRLREGDIALLALPVASRDPAEYEDPTAVRLDRSESVHYAFGLGPHRCLGSHLARLELRIALDQWHARIPDYELAGEVGSYAGTVMGVTALPLRWS